MLTHLTLLGVTMLTAQLRSPLLSLVLCIPLHIYALLSAAPDVVPAVRVE